MKRIIKKPQDTKNTPQVGSQLSIEERLKVLASLIVDRALEKEQSHLQTNYHD